MSKLNAYTKLEQLRKQHHSLLRARIGKVNQNLYQVKLSRVIFIPKEAIPTYTETNEATLQTNPLFNTFVKTIFKDTRILKNYFSPLFQRKSRIYKKLIKHPNQYQIDQYLLRVDHKGDTFIHALIISKKECPDYLIK